MDSKYISNKTLIIRIVLTVLLISVAILVVSTEYLKKSAVDNLAADDAKKTAQLVFETMNTRMQEGWTKQDLTKIIKRLEIVRTGMKISSYRSPQVEELFGIVPEDKKIVDADPLILQAMNGEEIFKINEETGEVRFLYPMKTTTECNHCHINAQKGSVNGILDIRFPQSEIKISLDTIFLYVFIFSVLFLIVISYIMYIIVNSKMVKPVVRLTDNIMEIQASKDLTKRVDIDTNIKELSLLQKNFNNLLMTIKYYYDKLIEKIYTDDLTNINNITKLQSDLEKPNKNLSLLILDIQSFAQLNKVYGYNVSNFLLKQFASNLNSFIGDTGVVYRLYSNEFAITFNKSVNDEDVLELTSSLKEFIYRYKESEFILDLTIGYTTGSNDVVFENAMLALSEAKKRKMHIFKYDETVAIKNEDEHNIVWLNKLDNAIENDNIVPFFMPMKYLKTNKINKYETLVRMIEGDTVHTPDKFLDIAVSSGKYHVITQTMIKKVFEYFKDIDDIKFSINIALSDITDNDTMQILYDNLENYSCSSNVIIELLETEEISDFELLNDFIKKVKKYDAKVAIDDFGSGYSNYNYILNLDVDIVKLDSSLIENMHKDPDSLAIVTNIIKVLKELGLEVVAEKVFSEEIATILESLEVDYLQGFHIGRPEKDILK